MPNRTRASYETLFRCLRTEITNAHGNLGDLHTVLLDFESAAHDAVHSELGVATLGCTFHFGQCLVRRVQQEGLRQLYQNDDPEQDEDTPVRVWIGLIKSLALLPPDLVLPTWQNWLRFPPPTDDAATAEKFRKFTQYFEVSALVKN